MDPSYVSDDDDAEASAMAAAMGFSSFGTQGHLSKKRKFNPTTDAFVDGQELVSLDKGGRKGQGSGGNTIPLGKARVFGAGEGVGAVQQPVVKANDEEISLGDEGEEEGINWKVEGGPDYIDTSLPPPISDEKATQVQETINAILAANLQDDTQKIPLSLGSSDTPHITFAGSRGIPEWSRIKGDMLPLKEHINSPQLVRPVSGKHMESQTDDRSVFSETASLASSSRPNQRGQRNELWYINYYDPSFNGNPWTKIEIERGLEKRGTWLEKQGQRVVP
jgi:hypothetical protein